MLSVVMPMPFARLITMFLHSPQLFLILWQRRVNRWTGITSGSGEGQGYRWLPQMISFSITGSNKKHVGDKNKQLDNTNMSRVALSHSRQKSIISMQQYRRNFYISRNILRYFHLINQQIITVLFSQLSPKIICEGTLK